MSTDTVKKSVYIVDDHPIVRKGIIQTINQDANFNVCGEAEDTNTALNEIKMLKPDIAIVDILIDGSDSGLELIKEIKKTQSDLPVMVLSMYEDYTYAEYAFKAGATGYVMKRDAARVLIKALNKVLNGEMFVSEKMSSMMLKKILNNDGPKGNLAISDSLSKRELEIFQFIGQGQSTKKIAKNLCLSIKTIDTHRKNIKRKLNIQDSTELVFKAINFVQNKKTL